MRRHQTPLPRSNLKPGDIRIDHRSRCCDYIVFSKGFAPHGIHIMKCSICHSSFSSGYLARCGKQLDMCEDICTNCLHHLLQDNTELSSSSSQRERVDVGSEKKKKEKKKKEINTLLQWVHCSDCSKWRKLGTGVDPNALPEIWYVS